MFRNFIEFIEWIEWVDNHKREIWDEWKWPNFDNSEQSLILEYGLRLCSIYRVEMKYETKEYYSNENDDIYKNSQLSISLHCQEVNRRLFEHSI